MSTGRLSKSMLDSDLRRCRAWTRVFSDTEITFQSAHPVLGAITDRTAPCRGRCLGVL